MVGHVPFSFRFCPLTDCYIVSDMYPSVLGSVVCISLTAEYCDSRAVPDVSKSQYLKHLGAELHSNIDIMWTGTVGCIKLDQ